MAPRAAGHRWDAFVRSVVDYHAGICWICKHGGARQGDHVIPVTDRPDLMFDFSNVRPAHGAPGNPCPQCSAACGRKVHCNQVRSGFTVERARRLIAGWAAAHAAQSPPEARIPPESGRPW